uniref:Uncharacterized protein n=1 Tax=viral metagenome TaxID=1070528 RepID=A0A6H1ZA65_9ZZZZ
MKTTDTIRRDTWTLHVLNDEPGDERLSVVLDDCCAPTIINDDGEDEVDWGNADYPGDAEVSIAASEALGRPVVCSFTDGGDTLSEAIYDVVSDYTDTAQERKPGA